MAYQARGRDPLFDRGFRPSSNAARGNSWAFC